MSVDTPTPLVNTEHYFGGCPECGDTIGYINVRSAHWFRCPTHKTMWCAGDNLFSSWKEETEADWTRAEKLLADYREVEPLEMAEMPTGPFMIRCQQAPPTTMTPEEEADCERAEYRQLAADEMRAAAARASTATGRTYRALFLRTGDPFVRCEHPDGRLISGTTFAEVQDALDFLKTVERGASA